MSLTENPPFPRGGTYNPSAAATDGSEWIGREFWFDDYNWNSNPKTLRSGRKVKCRVVRNSCTAGNGGQVTTGNILPKKLVVLKSGKYGAEVDGYTSNLRAMKCYPADEFLPSAGVVINDLFYIVVEGPALVLSPLSNMSVDIAVGDALVAITSVTSGCTTSGRVDAPNYNVATTVQSYELLNAVGRALSTCLTNSTNADMLIDVKA